MNANTVPTPSPTAPTPSAAYAGTRLGASGSALRDGSAGVEGADDGGGAVAGVTAATLEAFGSGSSVSATESTPPSTSFTFALLLRNPGALASTTCSPGSIGRFVLRFATGTLTPSTITVSCASAGATAILSFAIF